MIRVHRHSGLHEKTNHGLSLPGYGSIRLYYGRLREREGGELGGRFKMVVPHEQSLSHSCHALSYEVPG